MSSKLDMALGDIVSAERSEKRSSRGSERGGRGGGRGGRSERSERGGRGGAGAAASTGRGGGGPARHRDERRGGRRDGPYAPSDVRRDSRRVDPDAEFSRQPSSHQQASDAKVRGDTIFVSNLDRDVNQEDVYDIFSRVGPVRSAVVNYDQHGSSLGKAEVVFNSARDAELAVREYDGAEVDGRVMNVKLVGSFVRQPQVVKKQQPPPMQAPPAGAGGRQPQANRRQRDVEPAGRQPRKERGSEAPSRGRGEKRGRGGRVGGGGGRSAGEKPTAESLDAELDAYRASSATTAASTNGAETTA